MSVARTARKAPSASRPGRRRLRLRITGSVQGVGFRPYVYRLATELGLSGFVRNDERGVVIEAEGTEQALSGLLARLPVEGPPLASIDEVTSQEVSVHADRGFSIVPSTSGGEPKAAVLPDTATCGDCLAELFDPGDRRFRYPFINCTNCGPRLTIISGVPYDRRSTTMAGFEMCELCRSEYEDPTNRRFHAQPNACPSCGPQVRLIDGGGAEVDISGSSDVMSACARALLSGLIVAVKGLGGYHLACRADDESVVARLRARKQREDKPFALMAPGLEAARELVCLGSEEVDMLCGVQRPIVLALRKSDARVAFSVAPGTPELGVMLAYAPLHHLLLADAEIPLVMTSANTSDEPIAFRDDDALERLSGICDLFLVHNRPIHTRVDDSVARVVATDRGRRPAVLRRSRGYVPTSLALPAAAQSPLLACGAELKNTFCLVKGSSAWIGHHVGDLKNYESFESFRAGIEHFEALFAVEPRVICHDMHPDYLSTSYALEQTTAEHVAIQHHHAHLAACLAEHRKTGPAVGAIFDGTGYGTDGTVWGGELLVGGLDGFERAGHLWPVRMPGGEQAVRQPWRMACAWLVAAQGPQAPLPQGLAGWVDRRSWNSMVELVLSGLASPITTSVGRLFDAAAALCGLGRRVNYEGQAAIELEASCDPQDRGLYPFDVVRGADADPSFRTLVLDARQTVRALVEDLQGSAPALCAARFHNSVAHATADALAELARWYGTGSVVLSGGVFQNRYLAELCASLCARRGLEVLLPVLVPANDGGISFGQAAIAAYQGL